MQLRDNQSAFNPIFFSFFKAGLNCHNELAIRIIESSNKPVLCCVAKNQLTEHKGH